MLMLADDSSLAAATEVIFELIPSAALSSSTGRKMMAPSSFMTNASPCPWYFNFELTSFYIVNNKISIPAMPMRLP